MNVPQIAEDLARDFATTAIERDRRGGTAKRERDLLRRSGLLNLIIPPEYGGAGASWPETLRVVRRFAQVDGSLAHLFGFQHLLLATARLFGTQEQWGPLFAKTVRHSWFWGNALNPLDLRTTLTLRDGQRVISGTKSFCSGAADSDMLIVSATKDGRLIVAAIPTRREGVRVLDDWNNMGQRQTDSGTVELHDVRVEEDEILAQPGPLGSPFASLRPCIAQLVLANVYLGIALGALEEAKQYTRTQSRAWFASGVAKPTQDPYVLRHYGNLALELESAQLVTDHAAAQLQSAWELGDDVTPEHRGHVSLAIAAAKVATTRAGLEVTSRIFEVTGARATASSAGLDRHWRNLRTHTLHDPVEYKVRDLGNWALNGEFPQPSFYS